MEDLGLLVDLSTRLAGIGLTSAQRLQSNEDKLALAAIQTRARTKFQRLYTVLSQGIGH